MYTTHRHYELITNLLRRRYLQYNYNERWSCLKETKNIPNVAFPFKEQTIKQHPLCKRGGGKELCEHVNLWNCTIFSMKPRNKAFVNRSV